MEAEESFHKATVPSHVKMQKARQQGSRGKHCLNHKQFCSLPKLSILGAILSTWSPIGLDLGSWTFGWGCSSCLMSWWGDDSQILLSILSCIGKPTTHADSSGPKLPIVLKIGNPQWTNENKKPSMNQDAHGTYPYPHYPLPFIGMLQVNLGNVCIASFCFYCTVRTIKFVLSFITVAF